MLLQITFSANQTQLIFGDNPCDPPDRESEFIAARTRVHPYWSKSTTHSRLRWAFTAQHTKGYQLKFYLSIYADIAARARHGTGLFCRL